MNPRQIRSALKVMDVGSVQGAARELHLAPSSVSAQLRELASTLGVTLFETSGRGIIPTQAMQQLLPSFRALVALTDEIMQQAQHMAYEPSGVLRLFAPSSMCIYRLPPLIEALQQRAPQVEVVLTHEPFDYRHAFSRGELDAAILVSQADSKEWASHRLATEEVVFVCHPDRHQTGDVDPAYLNAQPIITTEPGCSYRLAAETHFREHGFVLKPRQSFANVEVVRRCLLTNMGIGLLPYCVVADDIAQGQLCHQLVSGTPYGFYSALVYPRERRVSPALDALIACVHPTLSVP